MQLRDHGHYLGNCNDDVDQINLKLATPVSDQLAQNPDRSTPQFLTYKCQNSALITCQRSRNNYCFCFKSLYKCI